MAAAPHPRPTNIAFTLRLLSCSFAADSALLSECCSWASCSASPFPVPWPGLRRRSPEPTREHPPRGSRRSRPTQRLVGGGSGTVEALEALDAHIALQETKIAASAQSIETAEAEAAQAQTEADILAGEIEAIRDRLRRRAVDAYVAPATDALDQLNSDDLIGSALRREYLDDIVGDEYEIVDQLRGAIAEQEALSHAAQAFLAEAQAERAELDLRRAELEVTRTEAEQLRAEVQERIAEWQTRSDEFAEADRLIGEEIRRLEEEARIAAEAEAQRLAEEEARRLAEEEAQRLAEEEAADDPAPSPPSGDFAITHRPTAGALTSSFGPRVHPIFGTTRTHNGIDLSGDTGDLILAANDGVVLSAGWRTGYGNAIVISHGGGYTTSTHICTTSM